MPMTQTVSLGALEHNTALRGPCLHALHAPDGALSICLYTCLPTTSISRGGKNILPAFGFQQRKRGPMVSRFHSRPILLLCFASNESCVHRPDLSFCCPSPNLTSFLSRPFEFPPALPGLGPESSARPRPPPPAPRAPALAACLPADRDQKFQNQASRCQQPHVK